MGGDASLRLGPKEKKVDEAEGLIARDWEKILYCRVVVVVDQNISSV